MKIRLLESRISDRDYDRIFRINRGENDPFKIKNEQRSEKKSFAYV